MSKNAFWLILSFCVLALSVKAEETPVAGEIVKKPKSNPYAMIEPQENITDIMPQTNVGKEEPDIYFVADELISNEKEQTLEALGDVVVKRETLTLYTDKLVYDQRRDTITATGNVRLVQPDGNTVYADEVELSDKMSRADMNKIKVIMRDETKIWAEHFHKKSNNNKVMRQVVYTPCDFCEGVTAPLWRIRARKVTHDAEKQDVNYNDAVLDIKNIPVLYTPFLSHPDPSVKRRSGFMPPKIGSSNYLGGTFQPNYYWAIDPYSDLMFSPIFSTDKDIVWGGRYRKYFYKGYLNMEGSYLKDDDPNRHDNRGNLFAKARYEINDDWVLNANINYASDDLYLKELDMPKDDEAWLTSSVALERFDGRDYASVEAYYYKLMSYDIRQLNRAEYLRRRDNRPTVLPYMDYEKYGDISPIGSYWKTNLNMASVYHEDDSVTQRVSMINSWNLPWISPYGERYKIVASVKSDAYYVDSFTADHKQESFTGETGRIFPQIGIEWRLPFVKATETTRQIIEPVVVAVLAPNGGNKASKIPNEDSQDDELSDTNILDLDRYAGYDRNDTGSRVTYGLNWSSYGNVMGRTSAFIAQTYQFNKHASFSNDIENKGHLSDYVGRIYAAPSNYLDLNYRFRLDKDHYKLQYNELGARIGNSMLNLYVSYIYLQKKKNDIGSFSDRKELYTSLNAALTKDWSVSIYNRQDLATEKTSLEHGGNLIYEDECFMFITTIKKYNSNNPSLDDSYEFNFVFYLKTLGGMGS